MQNPYEPTRDFDASHYSAAWGVREWIIMVVLVGLAVHGMVGILEDYGAIVWHGGEQHFWFEEDLKRWIHGRR
jgi:hypothetical protein